MGKEDCPPPPHPHTVFAVCGLNEDIGASRQFQLHAQVFALGLWSWEGPASLDDHILIPKGKWPSWRQWIWGRRADDNSHGWSVSSSFTGHFYKLFIWLKKKNVSGLTWTHASSLDLRPLEGLFLTIVSPLLPSWNDSCLKGLIFSDSLFSKPGKMTKVNTRRIMILHETVSSIDFSKALMLSKIKASPGLEEGVGWHQATMWDVWPLSGDSIWGADRKGKRQYMSIPEQGTFLEVFLFNLYNSILRQALISPCNIGRNWGSETFK